MKQYFNVTYEVNADLGIFSANIAHAECEKDVLTYYQKNHPGKKIMISNCPISELEEARRKGKPIVEIENTINSIKAYVDTLTQEQTSPGINIPPQEQQDEFE